MKVINRGEEPPACIQLLPSVRVDNSLVKAIRASLLCPYAWYGSYELDRLKSAKFMDALFIEIEVTLIILPEPDSLSFGRSRFVNKKAPESRRIGQGVQACRVSLRQDCMIAA